MTHLNDDELVLLHYGEETGAEAKAHLEACPDCGERVRRLGETLALAGAPETPEPDDGFEARVWARLQPRLAARGQRGRVGLAWGRRAWPRAAGLAALAASLLVAFLLGRELPSRPLPLSPEVRERVLLVAVGEHLERSRVVLVEIANAPGGEPLDVSLQRAFADELVSANRLYRQSAVRAGEAGLAAVLDELERVLVEVAAGPEALGPGDLAELQRRIESRGLLFKVGVVQSQVRAREEEGRAREDELYERGTEALDEGAWGEAASAFRSVADLKGRRADAGLYWLAYAKSRQGQGTDALAVLDELRRANPQSRWLKEAKALELEIRQRSGQPTRPESVADEDLKLMALNGLLDTDPEQAIPLLEKFLKGNRSPKLQDRALFVLCQSGSPRAREIVLRIARGESNPELQRKAIQNLGIFGGKESRQALQDIYAASTEPGVRKAVLQAFMVAGEKDRVLGAARTEKDPELRRHAIQMLGAMGAQSELWAMYQAETSQETKKAILQALGVGGGVDRLLEVARTEKDMEVRLEAIRMLGPFGGPAHAGAIVEIYKGGSDPRVREAALQALFVQGNAKALIEIAQTEKDPELKKQAVAHLAVMGSKEATAYLLEILNK